MNDLNPGWYILVVPNWRNEAKKSTDIFSHQCCDDLEASLTNLQSVAEIHLSKFSHGSIITAMFNSNAIENFFCQQRIGGNDQNPTCAQYASNVNAVIPGQKLTTRAKRSMSLTPNKHAHLLKTGAYSLYWFPD